VEAEDQDAHDNDSEDRQDGHHGPDSPDLSDHHADTDEDTGAEDEGHDARERDPGPAA